MPKPSRFKWFKTSPEIISLAVMLYVRFPLSLRNVEDLLHDRGIHKTDVEKAGLVQRVVNCTQKEGPDQGA